MKLKIEKDILLIRLNEVSKALSSRNIIPVLNGIKFELNENGLYLTATDNDLTIKSFINKKDIKEIIEEGTVIIYGRFLLDILRKLPNEDLIIEEIDGNRAVIRTNSSKYNLNCFDVEDFPNIKIEELEKPIKLMTSDFKQIITQTVFATSTQESRPLLTGVNLKILGNLLECVGTDSYRLAKKIIKLDKPIEDSINIVIPAKNMIELLKVIEDENDILELHAFSNKILFKYNNLLFQSSLLNGTYPNTDSLVPNEFETILSVNISELYNIIDRASLLAQAKEKNIVQLETKDDNLIITSSSLEIGRVEEVIKINKIKGNDVKISFSARYMMDALKSFSVNDVQLMLNEEIKPIIVKEKEDGDLTQLILPIKTY